MDLISRKHATQAIQENIRNTAHLHYDDHGIVEALNEAYTDDIATIETMPSAFEGLTNGEVIIQIFDTEVLKTDNDKIWVKGIYLPFDRYWWESLYKQEHKYG